MPRMNILNAVEQEAFESAPVFNSFQRKQYFDFPQAIQQATANLRTPANQLCFLLSCGYTFSPLLLTSITGSKTTWSMCCSPAYEAFGSSSASGISDAGPARRLLVPKYPFGIFYVVKTNRIVIHAILDLRQDPTKIDRRFGLGED